MCLEVLKKIWSLQEYFCFNKKEKAAFMVKDTGIWTLQYICFPFSKWLVSMVHSRAKLLNRSNMTHER